MIDSRKIEQKLNLNKNYYSFQRIKYLVNCICRGFKNHKRIKYELKLRDVVTTIKPIVKLFIKLLVLCKRPIGFCILVTANLGNLF